MCVEMIDTRPRMCRHQSFLVDYRTPNWLNIGKKWIFLIFFASLTLKWPWCDLEMTLVLCTSKAQLLPMLLFAHKITSCLCLQTNLTYFSHPSSPWKQRLECSCAQEFSFKGEWFNCKTRMPETVKCRPTVAYWVQIDGINIATELITRNYLNGTLIQCCFNARPTSATLAQHWTNIE